MKVLGIAIGTLAMIVTVVFGPRPALAAGSDQPTAALTQAIRAFNHGDLKVWAAMCDSPAVAIDDFPPHVWQGATACADWARAFTAMTKQQGITPGVVTLGAPWHSAVTGNRAYLVYPVTFGYRLKAKPMIDAGVFTFVMNKTASGWRIAAWSWADRH